MSVPAEPFVSAVGGPLAPDELGITLTHEHLFTDWLSAPGLAEPVESVQPVRRVVEALERAAAGGVASIVDVTPENMGVSPLMMALVAERTPVNVVCATGIYCADLFPTPGWAFGADGAGVIAEHFVEAARLGLSGSGVKPGIIKVATSGRAVNVLEENALRGAAVAQREVGLPVTTHTEKTRFAAEQIEILADQGADLGRVVIGHIGWGSGPEDLAMHLDLLSSGATVGLDMIGHVHRPIEDYATIALDLIEAGHESRLLFSHDQTAFMRGIVELFGDDWPPDAYSGDFTLVPGRFLEMLRRRGVPEETLRTIMVDNPRRLLTIDPGRHPRCAETLLFRPGPDDPAYMGDLAGEDVEGGGR